MNDAVTGPPPGTRPKRNPNPLPRSMGRHEALQSANVGHKPRMRSATRVLLTTLSTLLNTSVTPNSPMTTARSSMPAERSTDPKVKRSRPLTTSMPTAAMRNPSATIRAPFTGEPVIMKSVQTMPSTIRAKFSGGPKRMATVAIVGAKNVITITPSVPATKEPIAAIHGAVKDRGEHHHSADGCHGERDRQQQGERRERAHAREHADQRPDQAAEKAEKKIIECDDDTETGEQPPDGLHASPTPRTSRQCHAQYPAE